MRARGVLIFVCVTSWARSPEANLITCSLATSVTEGHTQLTCYFPEDVGLMQKDIQVVMQNNENSTTLLDCSWDEGKPFCYIKRGLHFDRSFQHPITLKIPSRLSDDAENITVKCLIVPVELYNTVPCKFVPEQVQFTTSSIFFTSEIALSGEKDNIMSTDEVFTDTFQGNSTIIS